MSRAQAYANETYARFAEQVETAKDHISHNLGFDAWSVSLSDTQQAWALLVPEDIYKKYAFREELTAYIAGVFTSYYIDVRLAEWRDSSMGYTSDEAAIYYDDYCVNWCGSRHCDVQLQHHLLLVLAPGYWDHDSSRSVEHIPVPRLPFKWRLCEDNSEMPYELKQWAEVVTDAAEPSVAAEVDHTQSLSDM